MNLIQVLLFVGFNAAAYVDSPGMDLLNGGAHIIGCQTSSQDNWRFLRGLACQVPIVSIAGATPLGCGCVKQESPSHLSIGFQTLQVGCAAERLRFNDWPANALAKFGRLVTL